MVNIKTYGAPPVSVYNLNRGISVDDYYGALALCEKELCYKVCYIELPVRITDDFCDFELFSVNSRDLAKNLRECDRVLLFAATVGVGIDRLIAKYSRISPSRAVMLDAVGSERIETLCDAFCDDMKGLHNVAIAPRFSPGYGDLPLTLQREILPLLDADRTLGIVLSSGDLMSPTKSITALAGINGDLLR